MQFTDSGLYLGVVNACRLVPLFALSLPAGVLADRLDRRGLLLALQAGMTALTFVVGGLVRAEAPFWLFTLAIGAVADWRGAYAAGLVMGGGCIAVTLLVLLVRPGLWGLALDPSEKANP